MALPELTKQQIEKVLSEYCEKRVPLYARDQVRVGFRFWGNSATIFEERPAFGYPETWVKIPVAQFRFDVESKEWTLYWPDRNSRWHIYYDTEPTTDFDTLLQEVEEDPTSIFWG